MCRIDVEKEAPLIVADAFNPAAAIGENSNRISMKTSAKKALCIKKAVRLTDLKWLNLFNIEVVDTDGNDRKWQVVSRRKQPKCTTGHFDKPDAVVIVPFHAGHGKIVITREYRVALAGDEYGFPAGLVDNGETVVAAARRELQEETGLTTTRVLFIGPPVYSSAGMTDESVAMVYVECDGDPSTAGNEGTEQIEVILATAVEVGRLCADPEVKFDAKAWLVLTAFARHGRL
jgi:ADP-ribose pyrophosphatase